jgi:hypothetical protein
VCVFPALIMTLGNTRRGVGRLTDSEANRYAQASKGDACEPLAMGHLLPLGGIVDILSSGKGIKVPNTP